MCNSLPSLDSITPGLGPHRAHGPLAATTTQRALLGSARPLSGATSAPSPRAQGKAPQQRLPTDLQGCVRGFVVIVDFTPGAQGKRVATRSHQHPPASRQQ